MLYCIITILGPVSGAHFNPIVSFAFVLRGKLALSTAILFVSAQILGGICGVWLTHAMFDQSIFHLSQTDRSGANLWISEVFASTGLLCVIWGGVSQQSESHSSFGWRLYIGCLLVYFLNQFCKSCSFNSPCFEQYFCRYKPR